MQTWHAAPAELPGIAQETQFRTISEAAARVAAGDTVVIHGGTYREHVVVEASGTAEQPIRFVAAPGERAVVTGADLLTEWETVDAQQHIYRAPWPHDFLWRSSRTHLGDDFHVLIGRAEQVIVNGYLLHQVLRREQLSRGSFYVDLEAKQLYLWGAAAEAMGPRVRVEASVRPTIWESRGEHIHLRGLRFRYAANHAQRGAARFAGNSGVVEDCVFERTNGNGASFNGEDIVARRCTFQDNGQLGFGGGGPHRLLVTGCLVRNNNTKGFNRDWEGGGNKIALARGVVFEKSMFIENRGSGVWFDIGNEDCVVRNCLIADNEECGIFYEISYRLHAHDNVIVGNGFGEAANAWGILSAISFSSSPGCVIERNLLVGNNEGLSFREQERTTWHIGDPDRDENRIWNHDEEVRHNAIAYNRAAQTRGWFDVEDERYWPAALQEHTPSAGAPAQSLEELKFSFHDNCYYAAPGQRLFTWGPSRTRHQRYADLDAVREALDLEQGSVEVKPDFADQTIRDFRVPADSSLFRMGCYPQGEVPGVKLGVLPR